MTISVGDRLPDFTFRVATPDGPVEKSTAEIFGGRKVVLFAVPGAFTPTCSNNHLPGYLENEAAIREKGVDEIAVIAVNDHHVMRAWAKASGGEGRILFIADGSGLFTKAIGLENDLVAAGLGIRSKRYAMIVEDGVVTSLGIEDAPGVNVSGAPAVLAKLA
jgi:peroxiredoxin